MQKIFTRGQNVNSDDLKDTSRMPAVCKETIDPNAIGAVGSLLCLHQMVPVNLQYTDILL